jgi:hypothetical protein
VKRSKRIYILLGVLSVSCMATLGVMRWEEEKEKIKNSDEIILALSSDQVTSISWEIESETLAFHKGERWLYDEDEAFPVDEEKIGGLLEQFQEFGAAFVIEEVEDYGQYGLDDPACAIRLGTEEQSYEILLGSYSSMDSQRYVSIGNGNVYLVKHDPLDDFDVTLREMIDHDQVPEFEKAAEIQFEGTENYSVVYEENGSHTYCADDTYFTERDGNTLPLDTSMVNRYLKNMSSLNLTDYVTYNASDEELESYGLVEPELTVTVEYISKEDEEEYENQFVLSVSRDPKEKKDTQSQAEDGLEETGEEITAYARVGESRIVYEISSEEYKELMKVSFDSLRHKEVIWADFGDISQVDISLEGMVYHLTSKESKGERIYYYKDEEVEIDEVLNALEQVRADSFTAEKPTQKEEIGLTVYLDNKNDPEVLIELYRYDGKYCLAAVDGEPVSLVARSDVINLAEAVYGIVLNEKSES